MKKISLALIMVIIVGALFVPAVSAETIIDETFSVSMDTSGTSSYGAIQPGMTKSYDCIILNHIENHPQLNYIGATVTGGSGFPPEGSHDITYTITGGMTGDGVMYVDYVTNAIGTVIGCKYTLFFYDWNPGTLSTGRKVIKLSKPFGTFGESWGDNVPTSTIGAITRQTPDGNTRVCNFNTFTVVSRNDFINSLRVTEDSGVYNIQLTRVVNGISSVSSFDILKNEGSIYHSYSGKDLNIYSAVIEADRVKLVAPDGTTYIRDLSAASPDDPTNATVTVYIRNSQTGAAIANSRCVIDALVDGDYYPVVNRTEPSGVFSVTLQPTGGGTPNPDGYRLIASADGYNNPMPEINFTVDEYTTSIYCYLDPIAGGPLDENNTFIDFFVRDMSANPISGATVKFGDYTLLTNSQGYTIFEVGKNATYTYTVSKSGYGSLMGNAVIGEAPRHTINTVLAPAVTPTTPTSIPTSTHISPTPTMTAPTGEPVSNWLDWFAAHFGMILGGGVEIGKIFMWLCFAVPVGVYVGKEAKAGAAGFMAGAGIVTLFFVLIGWVPIWLLVLLALIIGLLYAKVFNNSDSGGSR